jgi:hypothetical protein
MPMAGSQTTFGVGSCDLNDSDEKLKPATKLGADVTTNYKTDPEWVANRQSRDGRHWRRPRLLTWAVRTP